MPWLTKQIGANPGDAYSEVKLGKEIINILNNLMSRALEH